MANQRDVEVRFHMSSLLVRIWRLKSEAMHFMSSARVRTNTAKAEAESKRASERTTNERCLNRPRGLRDRARVLQSCEDYTCHARVRSQPPEKEGGDVFVCVQALFRADALESEARF